MSYRLPRAFTNPYLNPPLSGRANIGDAPDETYWIDENLDNWVDEFGQAWTTE